MLGRDRVVILVEPKDAVQNISRTMLRKPDGSELSWNHWQDQFRANLPSRLVHSEPRYQYVRGAKKNKRDKRSIKLSIKFRINS
jgi:hypothetical protein